MENENNTLLKSFEKTNSSIFSRNMILILVAVVFLGTGTGYILSTTKTSVVSQKEGNVSEGSSVSKGTIVGSNDLKTFKDIAEGVLKEGGVEGEGQFHLERPGGISQNVYLTSSIVDLSQFLDRKVKVNGETNKAQKAGWLMDVGRLEVLE